MTNNRRHYAFARHALVTAFGVVGARSGSRVLVPDFIDKPGALERLMAARPDVFNHNTETVPRLYKKARPGGRYERVKDIFRFAKSVAPDIPTKTGIIVGLGETNEEVLATMRDLRTVDVDILTIGQYLRPTPKHAPMTRYYHPDEFRELKRIAMGMGQTRVSLDA